VFNSSVEKDLADIKDGNSTLLQNVGIYQSTYLDTSKLLKNPSVPTRYHV